MHHRERLVDGNKGANTVHEMGTDLVREIGKSQGPFAIHPTTMITQFRGDSDTEQTDPGFDPGGQ